MKQAIDISSAEVTELEQFVSKLHMPVKIRPNDRNASASNYGVVGQVSQFGEITVELMRMIGSFEMVTLADCASVFFTFCRSGRMDISSSNRSYTINSGQSTAYSRPKSIKIYDDTELSTIAIGHALLLRRLTKMLERPVVPDLVFQEDPIATSPKLHALECFAHQWFDFPLLDLGRSLPEKSESLSNLVADSFILGYPNNYTEALTRPVPTIAPKHVKRAIDYIHSNPRAHTSPDVLAKLGNVVRRAIPRPRARSSAGTRRSRTASCWKTITSRRTLRHGSQPSSIITIIAGITKVSAI